MSTDLSRLTLNVLKVLEDPAAETMNNSDYKSPFSKEGPVLLTSSLVSDTNNNIMMELLHNLKSLLTNTHHSIRNDIIFYHIFMFSKQKFP